VSCDQLKTVAGLVDGEQRATQRDLAHQAPSLWGMIQMNAPAPC
jgi:hypothetical protein